MNNDRMPARRMPPGRTVRREREARGWTQKDLAAIIGRPEQAISQIVNGEKEITPQTAIELARAFGTSAEFWNNLEANYRLWLASREEEPKPIERRARLYSSAPVAELKNRGWLPDTDDTVELEQAFSALMRDKSPGDQSYLQISRRKSSGKNADPKLQTIWLKRVEYLVDGQKVGRFDKNSLNEAIPQLLRFSEKTENLDKVPGFLMSQGIRFALVPHLTGTFLDGAMFRINGNPVVALTLRYDRVDSFWFTLMHELAHLVLGHKGAFLDTIFDREGSVGREEASADRMAQNWLVDARKYRSFVDRTRPDFSGKEIREFALSVQRHPAIVLGRLQFDGEVPWNRLRSLHEKVKPVLHRYYDRPIAA